jgi:thiamine transporter ThiT
MANDKQEHFWMGFRRGMAYGSIVGLLMGAVYLICR